MLGVCRKTELLMWGISVKNKSMYVSLLVFVGALVCVPSPSKAAALTGLDKLETCKTKRQIENAEVALAWISAYNNLSSKNFTDIKTQLSLFAARFSVWHGSLAGLAAAYKDTPAFATLPFPTGQLDRKNFAKSVAFIAYANDMSKNKVVTNRVDCIQRDTVVVDISFSGFQVKRDLDGYITYGVEYSAPTTKTFRFDRNHRIVQQSVILDSGASIDARKRLAELLAKAQSNPIEYPPLSRDESTRGTLKELADALEAQAVGI